MRARAAWSWAIAGWLLQACSDGGGAAGPELPDSDVASVDAADSGGGGGDTQPEGDGAAAQGEPGVVGGTVELFGLGDHSGTVVEAGGVGAETDAEGGFSLALPAGPATLRFEHPPYQPVELAVEVDGDVTLEPITLRLGTPVQLGGDAWPLGVSPDGRYALFMAPFSQVTGSGDLWIRDLEQQTTTLLGQNVSTMAITGRPDGRALAFLRDVTFATGAGTLAVWLADTNEVRELGEDVPIHSVAFGPTYVVWLSNWSAIDDVGTMTAWRFGDGEPVALGQDAAIFQVELATAEALYFVSDIDVNARSGDLRRWEPASEAPPALLVPGVWRDFQSYDAEHGRLLLMTDVTPNIPSGTLRALDLATQQAVWLGDDVLPWGMMEDRARGGVLYVADYDPSKSTGQLRAYAFGDAAPVDVAAGVNASYLFPIADGRRVFWFADYAPEDDAGTLGVWDFEDGEAAVLSPGVRTGTVTSDPAGARLAWMTGFEPGPETGDVWTWAPGEDEPRLIGEGGRRWLLQVAPGGGHVVWRQTQDEESFAGDALAWSAATGESTLISDDTALAVWFVGEGQAALLVEHFDELTLGGDLVAWQFDAEEAVPVAQGMPSNLQIVGLDRAVWVAGGPSGPGPLWALELPAGEAPVARKLDDGVDPWAFAVSPTGHAVAWLGDVGGGGPFPTGTVGLWRFGDEEPLAEVPGAVWEGAGFGEDGARFRYSAGGEFPYGDVRVVDVATGQTHTVGDGVNLQAMSFAPNLEHGIVLADSAGDLGTVVRWDVESGAVALGEGVPWFTLRPTLDLARASWLTSFDATAATGRLWTWSATQGALPVDEPVGIAVVPTPNGWLYPLSGADPSRDGLWSVNANP